MLSKCCCCVPLRTGSIILAVLGILGGFANIGGLTWYGILDGIFYLVGYGALLFGAIKYNQKAVLVNLVFTALLIVVSMVLFIIAIASLETLVPELRCKMPDESSQPSITCGQATTMLYISTGAGFLIGGLLNIYFWFCNYSFYLELKTGGGPA